MTAGQKTSVRLLFFCLVFFQVLSFLKRRQEILSLSDHRNPSVENSPFHVASRHKPVHSTHTNMLTERDSSIQIIPAPQLLKAHSGLHLFPLYKNHLPFEPMWFQLRGHLSQDPNPNCLNPWFIIYKCPSGMLRWILISGLTLLLCDAKTICLELELRT